MPDVLSVTDLHRRHGRVRAVAGVDLLVAAGEVVALLGPNGAGKTTLTDCVVGLLTPHAGQVLVLGADPRRAATRRQLGVVQQDVGFPTTLRVDEVVDGAATRVGRDTAAAAAALAEVGLGDLAGRRAARLSGGQQRRLQLAMALVADPRLLVLDEPTEGLDVTARREFWHTLSRRRDAGAGVLLTTHAVAEAAEVADRVVVLQSGRVVAHGTPDQLTARVADLVAALRTVATGGRVVAPELAVAAWEAPDPLTDRERDVLRLAAEGEPNAGIAGRLFLAEGTVRNHLSSAIAKLGVRNRTEAAARARERGWL